MKVKYAQLIRFFISLSLLAVLLYLMRGRYGDIITEIKKTDLTLFAIAFFLFCINIAIVTLRLKSILIGENIRMPIFRLVELNYIGYFFNNFMPSAVGGDIVKAYYTGLITKEKAKSYVSVIMDRFTGLLSFAIIGFIALLFSWSIITDPFIKRSVLIFVSSFAVILIILVNTKIARLVSRYLPKIRIMNIGSKLTKVYSMIHNYKDKKIVLFKALFVSVVAQAMYFIVIYTLFRSVSLEISISLIFLIMPIVSIISMVPSLGGLGIQEGAIVALYGPIVGFDKAFGVSILLRTILYLISIVGGIIYLSSSQFRKLKISEDIKLPV